MTIITGITAGAKQAMTLQLPDGSKASFYMEYIDGQQGWFYSLTLGSFSVSYRRMVVNPNMLRAFRGIIDFGLSCMTTDMYEPIFINDFSTGRAKLYLLDSSDIEEVESILNVN